MKRQEDRIHGSHELKQIGFENALLSSTDNLDFGSTRIDMNDVQEMSSETGPSTEVRPLACMNGKGIES
jgi:hypothetical protein